MNIFHWLRVILVIVMVAIVLAGNGKLQSTTENVDENTKMLCNAREVALSKMEKTAIENQFWFMSSENQEFVTKIYDIGSVQYCDADRLQRLLGVDNSKSIDRLRYPPCEAYTCLTGG